MTITTHNSEQSALSLDLIEIQAVAHPTRKRRGEMAEAAFLAKASSLGFGVAKPWGDSERYDFILDSGHHCWRVQVKSTACYAESRYRVKAGGSTSFYARHEIDFLVAYLVPEDLWYVIPVEAFCSRKWLRFYPREGSKAVLEKYREAWCLMAAPKLSRRSKTCATLTSCRCPELSVRCRLCPMKPEG